MKDQLRVLCADDVDTCEMVSAALGFSGIEVRTAYTYSQAWQLAQTERFDLYLLETRFSDGDVYGLRRQIH